MESTKTLKLTADEIKEMIERKHNIEIEKITLSWRGCVAILK